MKYLIYISICLSLFSCKKWKDTSEEKPIAEVNGNFLYPSDVSDENNLIPDSISWNDEQINHWVKKQLWLIEAEKNKDASIERRVQDYRESLLVDAYKNEFIQNSKVVVTEELMLEYYKQNQGSFLLNEEMFKIQFFHLENIDENADLISQVVKGETPDDLKNFCDENADKCILDATWVGKSFFEDLGIPSYLWVSSTRFQKYFLDNNFVYLYRIDSKRKKGEVAPLEQVKGDIKQILTVQLEKELLQKKEDELFINAQNNKSFEIY